MRADQGVHFIYPSAWTPHVYSAGSPIRDEIGYLNNEVVQNLELRRLLSGDFDIVLEWDGFDLASPGTSSPDINRYSDYSVFSLSVLRPDGSNLCYLQRGFARYTSYFHYQNFYGWYYNGTSDNDSTTDSEGKFRFKRNESAFDMYYWDAGTSSWVNCSGHITSGYTTGDLRLVINADCHKGSLHYRVSSLTHNGGTPVDFSTTTGTYTSSLYDAGQSVQWSRIAWDETLPSNTDVKFQLAFSNSESGPWSFIGPDGTSGTYFTTPAGETLPNNSSFAGQYARFQAFLSTSDGLNTPQFGNVHLSFTGTGLLTSSCRNFAYDEAGNITSITTVTDSGSAVDDRNPGAHPINNLNQVIQRDVGGDSWTYSWDDNGNLTGKTDGTDTFTYTWSDENRLTRVQGPGGLDVSYSYDSAGRMLTRTSNSIVTKFIWDGWDCVREVTGTDDIVYHIPDGTLHSFALNGEIYQVHMDALSSVRMITDSSGTVVARVEYGAYGEEIFVSAIPELENFPYRFVGSLGVRTDFDTGLIYMRNRWYDSALQRFISRDPIGLGGGSNLYSYVGNSPTNYIDPIGLGPLGGPATGGAPPSINLPSSPAYPRPMPGGTPPPAELPAPVKPTITLGVAVRVTGYLGAGYQVYKWGDRGIKAYEKATEVYDYWIHREDELLRQRRQGRINASNEAEWKKKWDGWKRTGWQVWEELEKHRDAPEQDCNTGCNLKFVCARYVPGSGTKSCVYTNNGHTFTYEQFPEKPCYPINYKTCMVDKDYFGPNPLQH